MTTMQSQFEQWVRRWLSGRQVDTVQAVAQLLHLVGVGEEIRCTLGSPDSLRLEVQGQPPCEIALDQAGAKLRMMCARLAKLCQENGQEFIPYGGEGIIRQEVSGSFTVPTPKTGTIGKEAPLPSPPPADFQAGEAAAASLATAVSRHPNQWKVRFKNTMHEQELIIQAQ